MIQLAEWRVCFHTKEEVKKKKGRHALHAAHTHRMIMISKKMICMELHCSV